MKKITFLIALFPFWTQAQSIKSDNELLWEITHEDHPTAYLFGSFHSNDKRLFDNLSDTTYIALADADVIVLETDLFSIFDWLDTRSSEPDLQFDNEGKPYTSSRRGTETTYGDEDGMPQFLDAYFQQYCYNAGKQFFQLETVDFQMNLFSGADIRPDFNRWNLTPIMTSEEDFINVYLKGDIVELDQVLKSSLSMFPDIYHKLIVERNIGMAEKLDSLIQGGDAIFCAVGAGHLAGEMGLISLLRSKGYDLRKVTASYREPNIPAKEAVRSKRTYTYDNDTLGVHITFPGKPTVADTSYEEYELRLVYRDMGQGNTYDVEIYNRSEDIGLEELAQRYIASPAESPMEQIELENGGEAYQGLADSYFEGVHWTRVIANEEILVVIRAYGGNKFMNSPRAFRFFDTVWMD